MTFVFILMQYKDIEIAFVNLTELIQGSFKLDGLVFEGQIQSFIFHVPDSINGKFYLSLLY